MSDPIAPPVIDTPAAEPIILAAPEPSAPPEPLKVLDLPKPTRPFDPEMFDKLLEYYPDEIKSRLGVTALEVALARQSAVTQYGLSAEEADALPGKTAADITLAAKVTAGIIAKRLDAAQIAAATVKTEPPPFYRLPSEADAAKESDPAKRAMIEYTRAMGG